MILVPRVEGVDTKIIKTSYSSAAGTSYVTFDNVKCVCSGFFRLLLTESRVPVENTLGKEGKGLFVVLSNFNREFQHFTSCTEAEMSQMSDGSCAAQGQLYSCHHTNAVFSMS